MSTSGITHTLCPACGATVPLAMRPTPRHCGQVRILISEAAAQAVREIWRILRARNVPEINGRRIVDAIASGEIEGIGEAALQEIEATIAPFDRCHYTEIIRDRRPS